MPVAPTELWLANTLPAVYSKRNHVVVEMRVINGKENFKPVVDNTGNWVHQTFLAYIFVQKL